VFDRSAALLRARFDATGEHVELIAAFDRDREWRSRAEEYLEQRADRHRRVGLKIAAREAIE
jgi:hypothetical protein